MKKPRQVAAIAKKARQAGLPVAGGVNGGGWCNLAIACGYVGFPTKAEAKEFLRHWLSSNAGVRTTAVKPAADKQIRKRFVETLPTKSFPTVDVASVEFLRTYAWRQLRMQAIRKHGARCMCCGATPQDGIVIHVDHIKPRRLFPHLALDLENLQILCEVCNHGKGNWDQTDWRPSEPEIAPEVESVIRSIARGE